MILRTARKSTFGLRTPFVFIVGLLAVLGLLSACSRNASGKPKAEDRKKVSVPVTIGTAVKKTVPVQLQAIGNVQAFSTVSVKAQVSGELVAVHFKEGQRVNRGDLIFTIDPRPFEMQVRQAEANLARNRAQLQNALRQVERYSSLAKKGYVAEEMYDQVRTNAAALEASVSADEAAVEKAKLELKYCFIRSPVTGYTGELKVHQGNLIKANDNDKPLVTINQTSPIYVVFAVPEQNLPELKKHMATRKLEVLATVPGNEGYPVRGKLSLLDNTVDRTTGTIQLKATYANADQALWPGQFVNVILELTTQPDAVVLPSQALQTGQDSQYVFVVKPDLTVEYRLVVVGRTVDNEVVIEKGISPGEKVVTDGQLRLAPGAKVKIIEDIEKSSKEAGR